ncbi:MULTISPECIES: nuclear transport factor 2 family protein [unclassified Sphingobacterium]|uniref:nuclear transport factor 2 family protein n=1 Tax=unclassified Sphingobacterium TaxID=2609468 RepID=UPI0020C4F11C|nr:MULTISPECIES: nuclear transport factor 2 family protein [unclassified Sphingobacterium]
MNKIGEFITDFLRYMQERDFNNLVNLFAEEVKWEVPGDTDRLKWLGVRKNKAEIESFFQLLWAETEPLSAEIQKILADKDEAMIKGEFTSKMLRTNKDVTSIFFIHFKLQNMKIVEYTLLEDSFAVSEAVN